MRRYCTTWVVVIAVAIQAACATTSVSNSTAGPRFRAVGDLVLADSGELAIIARGPLPRFPADMKRAGAEAAFAAFFVVDTLGQVEYPTVSFAPDVPRPFELAVCSYLRDVRFKPAVRGGISRRALAIVPWTFGLEGGTWEKRLYDAEPLRRATIAAGLTFTVAQLESRPHC